MFPLRKRKIRLLKDVFLDEEEEVTIKNETFHEEVCFFLCVFLIPLLRGLKEDKKPDIFFYN